MAWIKTEDIYQQWIEAINDDGEIIGYIRKVEARRFGIRTITIEKPQKFIKDPYINYHRDILIRSGILTSGRDLNEVQSVLLLGSIVNERKNNAEERKNNFEEMLFANNPEIYKSYKEFQEQQELNDDPDFQQARPKSLEELLSMFNAFEVDSEGEEAKKPAGWLDAMLDEEDAAQIRD